MEPHPITQPIRKFARDQNVSPTRVYEWDAEGEIETVLIGSRRHVVLDSYRSMIARRMAEQAGAKLQSSNPKAKARQAAIAAPSDDIVKDRNRKRRGARSARPAS
jgi:hypothetical protein